MLIKPLNPLCLVLLTVVSLVDDAGSFIIDDVGELEHGSAEEVVDGVQGEGEGQEHGQA